MSVVDNFEYFSILWTILMVINIETTNSSFTKQKELVGPSPYLGDEKKIFKSQFDDHNTEIRHFVDKFRIDCWLIDWNSQFCMSICHSASYKESAEKHVQTAEISHNDNKISLLGGQK